MLSFSILVIVWAARRRSLIEKYKGFGSWAKLGGNGPDKVDWKNAEIPASFVRELRTQNARFAVALLILASGFAIYATFDWLID